MLFVNSITTQVSEVISKVSQAFMLNPTKMLYRNLGNTGLKVSVIGLGNMINYKPENQEIDRNLIKTCIENGVNFFDTAQMYSQGEAQAALGKYIKELGVPRQHLVISTKIWTAPDFDMNSKSNNNRKHLRESIDKSLKRLQMDYVDVLFSHRFDLNTPLEQICRGFNQIIQQGKAFYWATSNWNSEQIFQAFQICDKLKLHRPVAAQNQYNMLIRKQIQCEYRTLFQKQGYGSTFWSPLAGGFLTGKYLGGIPTEGKHRFNDKITFSTQVLKDLYYKPFANEKTVKALQQVADIAQGLGGKLNHLAIAWALKFKYTSTIITGARNPQQMLDNLKALQLLDKLTPQIQAKINKIIDANPPLRMNFTKSKQDDPMRPVLQ